MTRPSRPPWSDHPIPLQVVKLLIILLCSSSCHLISVFSNTLSLRSSVRDQVSHPYETTVNCGWVCFNLYGFREQIGRRAKDSEWSNTENSTDFYLLFAFSLVQFGSVIARQVNFAAVSKDPLAMFITGYYFDLFSDLQQSAHTLHKLY
jgi:hypothetical protein